MSEILVIQFSSGVRLYAQERTSVRGFANPRVDINHEIKCSYTTSHGSINEIVDDLSIGRDFIIEIRKYVGNRINDVGATLKKIEL